MKIQTIPHHPEPGTRCSEIVLTVRIAYDAASPFLAPSEWSYEDILKELESEHIQSLDISCAGYVPWVELVPMRYNIEDREFTTSYEQEIQYREHCRAEGRAPTQLGFWVHVLKTAHRLHLKP